MVGRRSRRNIGTRGLQRRLHAQLAALLDRITWRPGRIAVRIVRRRPAPSAHNQESAQGAAEDFDAIATGGAEAPGSRSAVGERGEESFSEHSDGEGFEQSV